MKALSLSQPWCWAIFDPIADKGIENRSWMPPVADVGTVIAIHAAKSWIDTRTYPCPLHGNPGGPCDGVLYTPIGYFMHLDIASAPSTKGAYVTSAIVGVATIADIVTDAFTMVERGLGHQRRWFFGPYGWVLTNRRALPRPIPASGKQGLWRLPALVEVEIEKQLGTVS